jgi:hypothetical protein
MIPKAQRCNCPILPCSTTAVHGMATYEWLQMHMPSVHHNRYFKLLSRCDKYTSMFREYGEVQ